MEGKSEKTANSATKLMRESVQLLAWAGEEAALDISSP